MLNIIIEWTVSATIHDLHIPDNGDSGPLDRRRDFRHQQPEIDMTDATKLTFADLTPAEKEAYLRATQLIVDSLREDEAERCEACNAWLPDHKPWCPPASDEAAITLDHPLPPSVDTLILNVHEIHEMMELALEVGELNALQIGVLHTLTAGARDLGDQLTAAEERRELTATALVPVVVYEPTPC
jgi:hypothetical protein